MKLLIGNINALLGGKLTVTHRGILITIALLKEEDPKMTLAKVKQKIKFSEFKQELVFLHENGYIEWSGYKSALKALEKERLSPEVLEVFEFMNDLWNRKFDPKAETHNAQLRVRLNECGIEKVKKVIANRYMVWKDDSLMQKYLHPETIFRKSKFDKYLEEAERTREGESFITAQRVDLSYGDEITMEIASSLSDDDIFRIKIYNTDSEGNKRGSGRVANRYGKDLKRMVFVENKKIKRGELKEYIYIYANK